MVIAVSQIQSVVAMVPHHPPGCDDDNRFFLVERPGLDVANLGGADQHITLE